MRAAVLAGLCVALAVGRLDGQATVESPAEIRCPSVLGVGIASDVPFCDVQVEIDPQLGIQVVLPPRRGDAMLSFNLHARHTYSSEAAARGQAFTRYLALVAIATMDGEIIGRGGVLSEFRTAADLVDRVSGGAGPTGLKAVAPTGTARVVVKIPPDLDQVVIVGQRLDVVRGDGQDTFTSLGRPVAVLSEARLDYHPR